MRHESQIKLMGNILERVELLRDEELLYIWGKVTAEFDERRLSRKGEWALWRKLSRSWRRRFPLRKSFFDVDMPVERARQIKSVSETQAEEIP